MQLTMVSPVEWHLGFPWQRFSSASLLRWQSEGHSLSTDEALHCHRPCKCNRFYCYIKHCICYWYAPRMSTLLNAPILFFSVHFLCHLHRMQLTADVTLPIIAHIFPRTELLKVPAKKMCSPFLFSSFCFALMQSFGAL